MPGDHGPFGFRRAPVPERPGAPGRGDAGPTCALQRTGRKAVIDPAGKGAARRSIAEDIPESDIDRMLNTALGPASAPQRGFAGDDTQTYDFDGPQYDGSDYDGTEYDGPAYLEAIAARARGPAVTMWDIPVFILYACLGVFTRIWTEITLYFDFGTDAGFRMFALGVTVALHLLILMLVFSAWRAKWRFRARNFTAIAALAGYLGSRMITQL